jgi:hypothetical protein
LKNKGFEEKRMTKIGWRAFVNSTTLESNKSLKVMYHRPHRIAFFGQPTLIVVHPRETTVATFNR